MHADMPSPPSSFQSIAQITYVLLPQLMQWQEETVSKGTRAHNLPFKHDTLKLLNGIINREDDYLEGKHHTSQNGKWNINNRT